MAEISVQFKNKFNGYDKTQVEEYIRVTESKLQETSSALAETQQQVAELEARLANLTNSDVAVEDNKCIIDLKKTQEMKNVKGNDVFYISFKNGLVPSSCEGGTIELYEKHTDFVNYKVTHHTDKVIISF